MAEYLGLDDVAADDRQGRRSFGGRGLFDDAFRPYEASVVRNDVEHAVSRRVCARHLDDRREIAARLRIGLDHLREAWLVADHQIVGEQYGERLVADQR